MLKNEAMSSSSSCMWLGVEGCSCHGNRTVALLWTNMNWRTCVCTVQTLSWRRLRRGRPAKPCRTCTRKCWSRTWSTPWTRRWSRTCKWRPLTFPSKLPSLLGRSWPQLTRVSSVLVGGTTLSRTRSPPCKAKPRTGPTPIGVRCRPICPCSWRRPAVSTLRWADVQMSCCLDRLQAFCASQLVGVRFFATTLGNSNVIVFSKQWTACRIYCL